MVPVSPWRGAAIASPNIPEAEVDIPVEGVEGLPRARRYSRPKSVLVHEGGLRSRARSRPELPELPELATNPIVGS